MTFRDKRFARSGNMYYVKGTEVTIYQWNAGKKANFLVCAGFRNSTHKEKSIPAGEGARDKAITLALEWASDPKYKNDKFQ